MALKGRRGPGGEGRDNKCRKKGEEEEKGSGDMMHG